MASTSYGYLYERVNAVLTANSYTPAPSGPTADSIPAHGADKWVAVDLSFGMSSTDSDDQAREEHELTLGMITARTSDNARGMSKAADNAAALRSLFDQPSVLTTSNVFAHVEPTDAEIQELPGALASVVTFTIYAMTEV